MNRGDWLPGSTRGLSWSGKWHIFNPAWMRDRFTNEERTFCGVYAYTFEGFPRHNARLMDIATGKKEVPMCKKCERSAVSE